MFQPASEASPASFASISATRAIRRRSSCVSPSTRSSRRSASICVVIVATRSSPLPGDLGEPAHRSPQHEAARAKVVARVELERDRLERLRDAAPAFRGDEHARGAGAQRREVRLAVARALGEDQDVAAAGEVRRDLVERRVVVGGVLVRRVLAANDRHRAGAIEQPAQAGHVPQRRLRDRRDLARRCRSARGSDRSARCGDSRRTRDRACRQAAASPMRSMSRKYSRMMLRNVPTSARRTDSGGGVSHASQNDATA